MNGARSTYRRKGYLLTALAAAVLLAASSGTAWAQTPVSVVEVTLSTPPKVIEGNDATITLTATAMVAGETATAQPVQVTLSLVDKSTADADVTAEGVTLGADATTLNPTATLTFAANPGGDADEPGDAKERKATATVTVRTNPDSDAEDEVVVVMAEAGTNTNIVGAIDFTNTADRIKFTIDDDEVQTYELTLAQRHRSAPPKEGGTIDVVMEAKPPHYDDGKMFVLHVLDMDGKGLRTYTANKGEEDEGTAVIGDWP